MELREKYAELIRFAQEAGVENLSLIESNNVLYVSGSAYETVKNQLWDIYGRLDPDFRAGDMILKIDVIPGGEEIYEVKAGDNLSKIARKYPGMTWQKIFEANKDILKNPDVIYPGQKLKIPV